MEIVDVVTFFNNVIVDRELPDDDCEYEVTKKAMESYVKYSCYKNWEYFLYQNSIADYLRNNPQEHRNECGNECRKMKKYMGAYLLKNKDGSKILTADILTSKNVPLKLCQENLSASQWEECKPYYKAFEMVNYWCGNMMPVICSFSPGSGKFSSLDNWKVKLNLLLSISEKNQIDEQEMKMYSDFMNGNGKCYKQKKLWPGWLSTHWKNNIKNFISENFLCDYVQSDNEQNKQQTICFVEGVYDFDFAKILTANDLSVIKGWFLNNAKLIIQRSYRIIYDVNNDFNAEQIRFITTVFEVIFAIARIPKDERDLKII